VAAELGYTAVEVDLAGVRVLQPLDREPPPRSWGPGLTGGGRPRVFTLDDRPPSRRHELPGERVAKARRGRFGLALLSPPPPPPAPGGGGSGSPPRRVGSGWPERRPPPGSGGRKTPCAWGRPPPRTPGGAPPASSPRSANGSTGRDRTSSSATSTAGDRR